MKKFDYSNATFIRYALLRLRSAIMVFPLWIRKSSDWGWLPLPFNQTAIADELKKRGGYSWQCLDSRLIAYVLVCILELL